MNTVKWSFEDIRIVLQEGGKLGLFGCDFGDNWDGKMGAFVAAVSPKIGTPRTDAAIQFCLKEMWVLHTGGDFKHESGQGMSMTFEKSAAYMSWVQDKADSLTAKYKAHQAAKKSSGKK